MVWHGESEVSRQGGRGSAPGDTQLTLGWGTTPVSGVLNLGDRTKNAGGKGHDTTGALCSKALAYQVVAILAKVILFLCFNTTRPIVPSETAKRGLPKTEACLYLFLLTTYRCST